jgi:integrating conjugative element protein (TIGR03749 family)
MRPSHAQRSRRQMRLVHVLVTALLVGSLAHVAAAAPLASERIEWNRSPVEVALRIGVERQMTFPAPVKVGVPASLKSALRVQTVNDTVYLQASHAFAPTRLVVQTRDGERTYLLDVEASESETPTPPLEVVDRTPSGEGTAAPAMNPTSIGYTRDPVLLTRFAAQQLYAPSRLLQPTLGIVRVPVPSAAFALLRGGEIRAQPVMGWRSGQRYITAVKLTNASTTPVVLDPRALRGDWLTATFQHHRLLPAGSEADTTVVYLVSARPFASSR